MYDLIIIGGGAAGLSAAIYASRYQLNTLIISENIGGTSLEAHLVENYPGFISITGAELMKKFRKHVEAFKVPIIQKTVAKISKTNHNFDIFTSDNEKFSSRTLLLATGVQKRKLGLPGEEKFLGKGVSYCATCDGAFFKNKTVAVVGGGDSAATISLFLAGISQKVYLITRELELDTEPITEKKLKNNQKIELILDNEIREIKGTNKLEQIIFKNPYQNSYQLYLDGLFIEIGSIPLVNLVQPLGIELDHRGFIKINQDGATNIRGIYAAGDITTGLYEYRQIITAAAGAVIAVVAINKYLKLGPQL